MPGLCTVANVKTALFPTGFTDGVDDALVQLYIDGLTQEVQEFTHRQFVTDAAPTTYLFDVIQGTEDSRTVYVQRGVQSVASMTLAAASQPDSGAGSYPVTVAAANILLRPIAQDRKPGFPADRVVVSDLDTTSRFTPGFNTVKLSMTCGFAAVPADIERLAVATVVRRFQARKGGQVDTIGASDMGGDILRFLSPEEWGVLKRYRAITALV